jgi:hypothetical protein
VNEDEAKLSAPAEDAFALVRKYPARRLVVDRTDMPSFKKVKNPEGSTLF